ncbi:uncharacterized protein CPUR_07367 [Claviceps purpurea 20.1]|uniref:EKC/KEOPS complex subunit BUD32 n=1 Tax=Claviceps purpurea (strain 20.1) TaxID=1111077 RepID=M1WF92_CLAP2|nr:uncharacterized protein CPUR_07367 [Claviceps purpurea 20.1]
MEESAAKIAHEKSMHELLMKHPHPNIVQCILCVPEGFFMERMEATLRTRIEQYSAGHVPSNRTKARWITQIASALSWIEGLGFVHGDLRPANILLTANENIRLADFDTSVKIGEELEAASDPFVKLNKGFKTPQAGPITEQFALGSCIYTIRFGSDHSYLNIRLADFDTSVKIGEELEAASDPFVKLNKGFKTPQAGPITEQFALGSCIYTIRFGHIPLDGVDPPDRVQKLMNNELPSTENDAEFGGALP